MNFKNNKVKLTFVSLNGIFEDVILVILHQFFKLPIVLSTDGKC